MAKHKFSQRTIGIIELRWLRGISAISIAGELGTTVERVQAVIERLENRKKAQEHFAKPGYEYELRGKHYVRVPGRGQ